MNTIRSYAVNPPPQPMYVYPDDKESAHVYYSALWHTLIDWSPVLIVLALALVVYIGLVVTGILPTPFAF